MSDDHTHYMHFKRCACTMYQHKRILGLMSAIASSKMSGFSAVSLPDSHSDYECFVSDIRKDFELRVETVQRTADENTRGEDILNYDSR